MRRILICFAFATLCFLNTWVELAQGQFAYYARYSPLQFTIPAVLLLQAAIAVALLLVWSWMARESLRHSNAVHVAFLGLCVVPAGFTSVAVLRLVPFDLASVIRLRWFWPVALAVIVPLFAVLARHPKRASAEMRRALLYSWPILGVILLQAFRAASVYPVSAYADRPWAKPLSTAQPRVRVVWIIFDEMSEALLSDRLPVSVQLPQLDRLRAQSVVAVAAHAPAQQTTESLPALLTGQIVKHAAPRGPGSLRIDGRVEWSELPNVFDRARGVGVDSALVGWFHPYGRILHRSLTGCSWSAGWLLSGVEEPHEVPSITQAIALRALAQRNVFPLLGHWLGDSVGELQRQETLVRYRFLIEQSERFVADPKLGLVFLHLPVPHPPTVYDRKLQRFATEHSNSYLDGLVLADWTLGKIRQRVRDAGLEESTAIIVSADHGWRSLWSRGADWKIEEAEAMRGADTSRVPFLVKLPGSDRGVKYNEAWNTVKTGDLVMEILQGRIATADHVVAFLKNPR